MKWLRRYEKWIEWGSTLVITVVAILYSLGVLGGHVAMPLIIGFVILYWAALLPRFLKDSH